MQESIKALVSIIFYSSLGLIIGSYLDMISLFSILGFTIGFAVFIFYLVNIK